MGDQEDQVKWYRISKKGRAWLPASGYALSDKPLEQVQAEQTEFYRRLAKSPYEVVVRPVRSFRMMRWIWEAKVWLPRKLEQRAERRADAAIGK